MKKNEILKKAIILEQQGQIFYRSIVEQTGSEALRQIFSTMAEEEKLHEATLRKQLAATASGEKLTPLSEGQVPGEFAEAVLTRKVIDEISGASYEAAAISAAMELEIRTVEYYSLQSREASEENEKKFFIQLAEWEGSHLKILSKMNRDILENALNEEIY